MNSWRKFHDSVPAMTTNVAPVNILKTGEDPELKPDEEYPGWLWKLASPPPTLGELSVKYEAKAEDLDVTEVMHHNQECLNVNALILQFEESRPILSNAEQMFTGRDLGFLVLKEERK